MQHWGEPVEKHRRAWGEIVNVVRPSLLANYPYGVRLLPSHRDWEVGMLSFLMIAFQRDGSQALEKNIPGL